MCAVVWKSNLSVEYDANVPDALLREMERHGRRLGLPMETLEVLGQDEHVCRDFVRHAEAGGADLFLQDLDLDALRIQAAERRRAHRAPVFDDGAFVTHL